MKDSPKPSAPEQTCEMLILADGTILAHNITPVMAGMLAGLDPEDAAMRQRAESKSSEVSSHNK